MTGSGENFSGDFYCWMIAKAIRLKTKYLRKSRMIRKIFTDFPKEKFIMQIDRKRLIRLLGYLGKGVWFCRNQFYLRKK